MKIPRLSYLFKGFGFFEYLLIASPIADVLVGIGKHNEIALISTVGPAHKLAIITLLVWMVIKKCRIKSWQAMVMISSMAAYTLHILYILLAYGTGDLSDNLNTSTRFWFFPIVVAGMMCMYDKVDIKDKWHRVLAVLAVLYSTLLLIPTMLGINNASYAEWLDKSGSGGLFYEANEIGIICGLLGAYMVMYYFLRKQSLAMLAVALVSITAGLTTGTKASLVYLIVAILFICVRTLLKPVKPGLNTLGLGIVVLGIILSSQAVVSNLSGSYERQIVQNDGSVSDIVFNGRDRLFSDSLGQFQADYSAGDKLLGGSSVEKNGTEKKDTEMDLADILFNFGIIGLVVYSIALVVIIGSMVRNRSSNVPIEKVCVLAGVAAAVIMGHTFSSPSVGLILAILIAIAVNQKRGMEALSHE